MSLRIIAGSKAGRTIEVPDSARPSSARSREAMFSSLHDRVVGANVLDLYAGAGALGMEALSRGARQAVFVDADAAACGQIRANLDHLRLTGGAVVNADVAQLRTAVAADLGPWDVVFADPPYDHTNDQIRAVLALLVDLLADDAICFVERPKAAGAFGWPDGIEPIKTLKHGAARLHKAQRDKAQRDKARRHTAQRTA